MPHRLTPQETTLAPVDAAALERVIELLAGVGSHPSGFRVTGTPEDARVAELVAAEMERVGLRHVRLEQVPVDAWRFHGARVTVDDDVFEAASFGGAPPTVAGGVAGELVDVHDARRARLDRVDVRGRIALVDWRSRSVGIEEIGLELGLRGATGMIVACFEGGPRFQGERALGTGVVGWHAQAPPVATLRGEDALTLRERCRAAGVRVGFEVDVDIRRGASGWNVVGVLPGSRRGAPLVVGAHHDGWFHGAFDNASGVAAMLGVAATLLASGWEPPRDIVFTSHTAEEYGGLDDDFSWCRGAWHQVAVTHPLWGASVPFYLNVEASGHPDLPLRVEGPPELRTFAGRVLRAAERSGNIPNGWIYGPPVTGTEAWPFQLRGIPSLSVYSWHRRFAQTDYHTTNDTPSIVSMGHLAALTRTYCELLRAAASAGAGLLDPRARARAIRRAAGVLDDPSAVLEGAAAYEQNGSRAAFSRLARLGCSVDAHGATGLLFEQAAADVRQLRSALDRLAQSDRSGAAASLAKVGDNHATAYLSGAARRIARGRRPQPGSWAARSHLTPSPELSSALASLRGERGARPYGPWLERSLSRALERQSRELERRTRRLAEALTPRHPNPSSPRRSSP